MSPDRILFVYDAPRHKGGKLLGEIRDFVLGLDVVTVDGRDLGTMVGVANAACALDRAMRGVSVAPIRTKRRAKIEVAA